MKFRFRRCRGRPRRFTSYLPNFVPDHVDHAGHCRPFARTTCPCFRAESDSPQADSRGSVLCDFDCCSGRRLSGMRNCRTAMPISESMLVLQNLMASACAWTAFRRSHGASRLFWICSFLPYQAKRDGRDRVVVARPSGNPRDRNLAFRDLLFCIFTTSDTTKLHAFLARPC